MGGTWSGVKVRGARARGRCLELVTKKLQLDDHRRRHVLVGVEPSHSSRRFVRLDQVADFGLV